MAFLGDQPENPTEPHEEEKTAKNSETGVSAGAGRALLRPNQSTMTN